MRFLSTSGVHHFSDGFEQSCFPCAESLLNIPKARRYPTISSQLPKSELAGK
jgi:hypothetical protein